MGRGLILQRGLGPFPNPTCVRPSHPVLSCVSTGYPRLKGRLPTCYSPVRRSRIAAAARLACLRRAASVRSEPGSNSPSSNPRPKTGKISNSNPVNSAASRLLPNTFVFTTLCPYHRIDWKPSCFLETVVATNGLAAIVATLLLNLLFFNISVKNCCTVF